MKPFAFLWKAFYFKTKIKKETCQRTSFQLTMIPPNHLNIILRYLQKINISTIKI